MVRTLFGDDMCHSRMNDPWSPAIHRIARRLHLKGIQAATAQNRLPFVGRYRSRATAVRMIEPTISFKLGLIEGDHEQLVRKLQELHRRIIGGAGLGMGEEDSWIIFYPVTKIP